MAPCCAVMAFRMAISWRSDFICMGQQDLSCTLYLNIPTNQLFNQLLHTRVDVKYDVGQHTGSANSLAD